MYIVILFLSDSYKNTMDNSVRTPDTIPFDGDESSSGEITPIRDAPRMLPLPPAPPVLRRQRAVFPEDGDEEDIAPEQRNVDVVNLTEQDVVNMNNETRQMLFGSTNTDEIMEMIRNGLLNELRLRFPGVMGQDGGKRKVARKVSRKSRKVARKSRKVARKSRKVARKISRKSRK